MLEEIAARRNASLVSISEPNKGRASARADWYTDITLSATIINIGSLPITKHGKGAGYVWVDVANKWRLYSCYISPNCSQEEFEEILTELGDSVRDTSDGLGTLLTGDFNAANETWGSKKTDISGLAWSCLTGQLVMIYMYRIKARTLLFTEQTNTLILI